MTRSIDLDVDAPDKVAQILRAGVKPMTQQFEVGKTYQDRSSCDWDAIYSFKIISRTAKTLTIEEHGETYKRRIYVYDGREWCKPRGTYSMCPVISADRETV